MDHIPTEQDNYNMKSTGTALYTIYKCVNMSNKKKFCVPRSDFKPGNIRRKFGFNFA